MLALLLPALRCAHAQNPGFESGDATGWADGGSGTETVQGTTTRTGSYAGNYQWNTTTGQRWANSGNTVSVPNNSYVHAIAWVNPDAANNELSVGINMNAINNGASYVAQTAGAWSRLRHTRQNTTGGSLTAYPYVNTRISGSGTVNNRIDDVVIYASTSSTTDLTDPTAPSSVSAGARTSSSIQITWANGSDAGEGIANTIVLRTATTAETSVDLNDQGRYSSGGGADGPNALGNWTVLSTAVAAGDASYTDSTVSADTSYKYAVIHRDTAFNYSSAGVSATVASLAAEPATHASALSFAAVGTVQMDVSWTSGAGARRIVVARAGSSVTWSPTDGTAPSGVSAHFPSAADQGSGNRICYDGTDASFTLSGLSEGTTYHVAVYEYNGSSSSVNYYTSGSPLSGSQSTQTRSGDSDIVRDVLFTEPSNIAYATYQDGDITGANGIEVARFILRDGGDGTDADSLGTTLTNLSLTVSGAALLQRLAVYADGVEQDEVAAGATVTFAGLALAAGDGEIRTFSILATFAASVSDNAAFQFTVSAAAANTNLSQFAAADAGGAATDATGDRNRIEVAGSALAFSSVPSSVTVGVPFAAVVRAVDALGNWDQDSTAAVTLSKFSGEGALASDGGLARALEGGERTWADLRISRAGAFTLRASGAGLTAGTSGAVVARVGRVLDDYDGTGDLAYATEGTWANAGGRREAQTGGVSTPEHSYASYDLSAALPGWYLGKTRQNAWCGWMDLNRAGVSGWGGANYACAMVLAANAADFNASSTAGYAVGLRESDDHLVVFRFASGIRDGTVELPGSYAVIVDSGYAYSDGDNGVNVYVEVLADGKWKVWFKAGAVLATDAAADTASYSGGSATSVAADETCTGAAYKYAGWVYAHSSGAAEKAFFDNLGAGQLPPSDADSRVESPVTQVESGGISSTADTPAEAVEVFRFTVHDLGTQDGMPTRLSRMAFRPGPLNTADWTDTIQDIRVFDGLTELAFDAAEISDASIDCLLGGDGCEVADGASLDLTVRVYLNAGGLVDGSILQFMIDGGDHGFAAAGDESSAFAADFGGDVTSGSQTIAVGASQLRFAIGRPPAAVGIQTDFTVEVSATDANGNRDADETASVTLSRVSGVGTLSSAAGLSHNLAGGGHTWTDVRISLPGTLTISAAATGFDTIVSEPIRAGGVWINEFDCDNPGTDSNEWVEIVGNAGLTLDDYELVFIDEGGTAYATWPLSAANWRFENEHEGYGFFVMGSVPPGEGAADYRPSAGWTQGEIQNGPDSIQLRLRSGGNVHLVDYGADNSHTAEDQVALLTDSAAARSSLYLTGGAGAWFTSFAWANTAGRSTPGAPNDGQTLTTPASAPAVDNGAGATGVGQAEAVLAGNVLAGYPFPDVSICWGDDDPGTTITGDWDRVETIGPVYWMGFDAPISGLATGTTYYYRCLASNEHGTAWAATSSSFATLTAATLASSGAIYLDDVGVGRVAPFSIDADHDGMADGWEIAMLGSTAASDGGAAADQDGDGVRDAFEYLAGTHPGDSNSFMRIVACDLAGAASSNVVITWSGGDFDGGSALAGAGDAVRRTYRVLASSGDGSAEKTPAGAVIDDLSGTHLWTDANAAGLYGSRFYSLAVSLGGGVYTNVDEWAMFAQGRPLGQRFLVALPVDLGTNANLGLTAGRQLARGLHAGASTNSADALQFWTVSKQWKELFLLEGSPAPYWYDPDTGTTADVPVVAGMALWVIRGTGSSERGNTVFAGRTYREQDVQITTNDTPWNFLGWVLPRRRWHRATVSAPNQLGLEPLGVGGTSGDFDRTAQWGDQIWVWRNNTWVNYYWLIGHLGGGWDGRWYDPHTGTFATFALEPGMGYYYYHPTNWGGANFTWTPSVP